MAALVLTIILGLLFALFATVNTSGVSINLLTVKFDNVPLYIIVLVSLLIGVVLSWLIYIINSLSTYLLLRRKESTIRELKKSVAELIKRVHQLEIEKSKSDEAKEHPDHDDDSI